MTTESDPSRRRFLTTAGVTAAAGVVGAGATMRAASASPLGEDVVITTVDAGKGIFSILVGEREVQIVDRAFAAKVADAIG